MPDPKKDNLTDALNRLPEIEPPARVWMNVRSRTNARRPRLQRSFAYAFAASIPLLAVGYFATLEMLTTDEDSPLVAQTPQSANLATMETPETQVSPTFVDEPSAGGESDEAPSDLADTVVVSPSVAAVALRLATLEQEVMDVPDDEVERIKELLRKQRMMSDTYRVIQPRYPNQTVKVRTASF